jgi:hypothetical protein
MLTLLWLNSVTVQEKSFGFSSPVLGEEKGEGETLDERIYHHSTGL